jgi:hypothetical protein
MGRGGSVPLVDAVRDAVGAENEARVLESPIRRDDLAADGPGIGPASVRLDQRVEPTSERHGAGRREHQQLAGGGARAGVPPRGKAGVLGDQHRFRAGDRCVGRLRLHDDELVVVVGCRFTQRVRKATWIHTCEGHENDRTLRWAGYRLSDSGEDDFLGGELLGHIRRDVPQEEVLRFNDRAAPVRPQGHRVLPAVADEIHPPHVQTGGGELVEQLAPRGAGGQPAGGTPVIGQHARDERLDAPPVACRSRGSDDQTPGTDQSGDASHGRHRIVAGRREYRRIERVPPRPPRRLVSGARARIGAVNVHERAPGQLDRDVAHDEHVGGAGGQQRFEIRPAPALAVRSQRAIVGEPVALRGRGRVVLQGQPLVASVVEDLLGDRLLVDDADSVEALDVVRDGCRTAVRAGIEANPGLSDQAEVLDGAHLGSVDRVRLLDPVAIRVPLDQSAELGLEEFGHHLVGIEDQDPVT